MAIETYKGIKVPTAASDSVNEGTTTVGGILIDNDKNLADRVTAIESRNITNWKFGDAEPDATLNPHEGDGYFRSTGMAYVYTNGAWSQFANLKGPSGSAVAPTVDTSAAVGGTTVTFTVGESSKSITVPNGNDGQDGRDGRDGTKIFTGTVVTGTTTSISAAVTDSAANDLYVNSSTGNLYIATAADTWNYLFTLKGTTGTAGTKIFTGTAVTGTDGTISGDVTGSAEGDFYINSSTGNFYKAVAANSWNYMFCSKGTQGQTGQNGNDGNDGQDGSDGFTPTITVSQKVNGVQTLTVTNKTGSTTTTINDGITGWNEAVLTDSTTTTLSDGDSVYSSLSMSAVTITTSSGWTVGHTARVGVTFASSSTFSYPSTWIAIGDDCSGGDFTFSQGSSYWLNMECKPDGTWMTVVKVPS